MVLFRDFAPAMIRTLNFGTFSAFEMTLMVASFAALSTGAALTRTDKTCDWVSHLTTPSTDERGVTRTEIRCSTGVAVHPHCHFAGGYRAQMTVRLPD